MASKRDRIVELKKYIESFGIDVNISKNKAQGNKGFFKARNDRYRIDVAKGLNDASIINTLSHEFSHFIHYNYDKSLKTLDFIFDDYSEELQNELIEVTVNLIPKEKIKPLFEAKKELKAEIKAIANELSLSIKDFKLSTGSFTLEKALNKTPYKHLLKHDRVKVLGFFSCKIYTIYDVKLSTEISENEIKYLNLKSKQRALKRINSKISKLNRYYNSKTELFARAIELYISDKDTFKNKAPILYDKLANIIKNNKIPELTKFVEIVEK